MQEEKVSPKPTNMVSDTQPGAQQRCAYELPFRRWLVREIESGILNAKEAIERFNFHPVKGHALIHHWRKRYPPVVELNLPVMTDKEKQELDALQKRVKLLEKQLEDAQMKAIALDTLIDVAEENLKIAIRKKAGTRSSAE